MERTNSTRSWSKNGSLTSRETAILIWSVSFSNVCWVYPRYSAADTWLSKGSCAKLSFLAFNSLCREVMKRPGGTNDVSSSNKEGDRICLKTGYILSIELDSSFSDCM